MLNCKFAGKITFWCPVDVQKTMINGPVEEIRTNAKKLITTLSTHNGGFISMAYTTPDAIGHTLEKTKAMRQAFREFEYLSVKNK